MTNSLIKNPEGDPSTMDFLHIKLHENNKTKNVFLARIPGYGKSMNGWRRMHIKRMRDNLFMMLGVKVTQFARDLIM